MRPTFLPLLLGAIFLEACTNPAPPLTSPATNQENKPSSESINLEYVGAKLGGVEKWSDGSQITYAIFKVENNGLQRLEVAGVETPSGFNINQPQSELMRPIDGNGWESPFVELAEFGKPPDVMAINPKETAEVLIPLPAKMFESRTSKWRACIRFVPLSSITCSRLFEISQAAKE